MSKRIISITAVFMLVSGITVLRAQETIPSNNGIASGKTGSLGYPAGRVAYNTSAESDGAVVSVVNTVPQPYVISVVTGINDANNIMLGFVKDPNQEMERLILNISGDINAGGVNAGVMNVETQNIASLHNINGNTLQYKKIESNETIFPMESYPSGTYFIRVAVEKTQRAIKSYAIIKM